MDIVLRRECIEDTEKMVLAVQEIGVLTWMYSDSLGVVRCGGVSPDELERIKALPEVEWIGEVSQKELEAIPDADQGPLRRLRRLQGAMGDFGPDDIDCGPKVRQMILDIRAGRSPDI